MPGWSTPTSTATTRSATRSSSTSSRGSPRERRPAVTTVADPGTVMDSGEDIAALDTIRRGIAVSPELTEGIRGTLALAVVASLGQVIVPVVVQQTLHHGLSGKGGSGLSFVVLMGVVAAAAIVVTSVASYFMTSRLFRTSERGL